MTIKRIEMKIENRSYLVKSLHAKKQMLCDVSFIENGIKKPIILFVHGFKGFKDWGHFNILAKQFAKAGYIFVKFNLSHNGTTPEEPLDFADLDAFGNNNYTIELDDIKSMLDCIESNSFPISQKEFDLNKIYIIGHSRGGGVSIIKASEDIRIKKLVTWASVARFGTMVTGDMMKEWKDTGAFHIFNSRTKQNMPLYYQLIEDMEQHSERFSIQKSAAKLNIPYLNIHGDNDETVPVSAASELKASYPNTEVHIIKGANHVFGATHPFEAASLPVHAQELLDKTIEFLNK
jgi:pimeloyl-ACP methyl ester carboxylesterase